jgi:hypothetical protein
MKSLILILLAIAGVFFLIANTQPKVEASQQQLTITHICDDRGVCCYERYSREFSCVATKVEVVLPEQGRPKAEGEVDRRTMEERVFRDSQRAFNPALGTD